MFTKHNSSEHSRVSSQYSTLDIKPAGLTRLLIQLAS